MLFNIFILSKFQNYNFVEILKYSIFRANIFSKHSCEILTKLSLPQRKLQQTKYSLMRFILCLMDKTGEVIIWDIGRDDDMVIASSGIGDDSHREAVSKLTWVVDPESQGQKFHVCSRLYFSLQCVRIHTESNKIE